MKFNQRGYTEIVTVSIIIGIIGSIFITGVFIWQEIDKEKLLEKQILKIETINKEKIPELNQENKISSSECANLGGEIINTLNQESCASPKNFLGTVDGLRCPCICCKKTEAINNNFEFIEIAKQHILSKPPLQLNGNEQAITWDNLNELIPSFSKITPEWITSQDTSIKYIEKDNYKKPHDYLNDKYSVAWFFIPGCEEDKNSDDKPNWFNDNGHQCLGGYSMRVLINPNQTIYSAELHALD